MSSTRSEFNVTTNNNDEANVSTASYSTTYSTTYSGTDLLTSLTESCSGTSVTTSRYIDESELVSVITGDPQNETVNTPPNNFLTSITESVRFDEAMLLRSDEMTSFVPDDTRWVSEADAESDDKEEAEESVYEEVLFGTTSSELETSAFDESAAATFPNTHELDVLDARFGRLLAGREGSVNRSNHESHDSSSGSSNMSTSSAASSSNTTSSVEDASVIFKRRVTVRIPLGEVLELLRNRAPGEETITIGFDERDAQYDYVELPKRDVKHVTQNTHALETVPPPINSHYERQFADGFSDVSFDDTQ